MRATCKNYLNRFCLVAVVLLLCVTEALASETEYIFRWEPGDTHLPHVIENAGKAELIEIRYDIATQQLRFYLHLSTPDTPEFLAEALEIIINQGFFPDDPEEYVSLYFDGKDPNNPILTAYTYNAYMGAQDSQSYLNGLPICTSADPTSCPNWLSELSVSNEADGSRIFQFVMDASHLNNFSFTPSFPQFIWEGLHFEQQIGLWLFTFGHPDISCTYNSDGYLTWFDPGAVGAEHIGFFDGIAPTEREPFCTGASGDFTVMVGEPFVTTVQGVSPDGLQLTVNYSGVPSGAEVTPVDGATTDSPLDVEFSWTPTVDDAGTVAFIQVTYTEEETGIQATCPFSVQVPVIPTGNPTCFLPAVDVPCDGETTDIPLGTELPEEQGVSYEWTTDCANAALFGADTRTPTLSLFDPGLGSQVACTVSLTVTDEFDRSETCQGPIAVAACETDCLGQVNGTAVVDRCGVCEGDGNSCLGCSDSDITPNQFALDSVAGLQAGAVKRLTRKLLRAAKGSGQEKSARKFRKEANAAADALFDQNWNLTWSIPSIVTSCTNVDFCVTISHTDTLQSYNTNAEDLFKLAQQTNRRIKKLGRNAKKLLRRARALFDQALEDSAATPEATTSCT